MNLEGVTGSQQPILDGRAANFGDRSFRHEDNGGFLRNMGIASQIGMNVEKVVMGSVLPDHLKRRIQLRDDLASELLPEVNKIKNDYRRSHRGGRTQTHIDRAVVSAYSQVFAGNKQTVITLAKHIDDDHGTSFYGLMRYVDSARSTEFSDHTRHHLFEGLLTAAYPNRVLSTFMAPGYALVPNVVIAAPHTPDSEDAQGYIQIDAVLIPDAGIGQFGTIFEYMKGTHDPDILLIELKALQRARDCMHPTRRPADTAKYLAQTQAMINRLLLRQYVDYGEDNINRCPIFPLPRTVQIVYARGLFEPTTSEQMVVDAAYLRNCAADWKEPGPESRVLQQLILSQAQKREKIERRTIFDSRKRHLPTPSPATPTTPTRKSSSTSAKA